MRTTKTGSGSLIVLFLGLMARSAAAEGASGSLSLSTAGASTEGSASAPAPASPAPAAESKESFKAPVELGLFGGLFFPPKNTALHGKGYVEQDYKSPAPELGFRAAWLPFRYAGLELEGAVMPAKTVQNEHGGFFAVRGHVLLQAPMGTFAPFLVGGLGRLGAGSTNTGTGIDTAIHFGIGAKLALDDFLALRLDLRDTLSEKEGGSGKVMSPEALLGLTFMIGEPRKEVPPPAPVVAADTDGDGKTDDVDKCPKEAANTPDGCPIPDTDLDGFTDDKDACPNEIGKAPCGCPIRDRDGDKIIDELDQCPDQPGPIGGCPDPDEDRDGVPLPADQCPDKQETKNGYDDSDGCPDEVPEKVKKFTGVIQGIEFDRAKDTIRPVSAPVLDGAVAVLKEYPALRLLISGHTDTDGDRAVNMDLSRRRAESVKTYFVSKGIAEDRIETLGAGPDQPIADNKTAAGRQKNRRIEFKLLPDATGDAKAPPAPPPGTPVPGSGAPTPAPPKSDATPESTPSKSEAKPAPEAPKTPAAPPSAPSGTAPGTKAPAAPSPSTTGAPAGGK